MEHVVDVLSTLEASVNSEWSSAEETETYF